MTNKALEKIEVKVLEDGTTLWYKNGKLHRTDGPAVEYKNYCKFWYRNGKLHRLDGPAIEQGHIKIWYKNGKQHRTNGPAIEYGECKIWYKNGIFQREEGPKIINSLNPSNIFNTEIPI